MTKFRLINGARAASIACGIALLWTAGAAFATEQALAGQTAPAERPAPADHPAPTKEQREKMAQAHEKLAACLRSDRPIDECHAEMMKMHESMKHEHAHMDHPAPEATPK